jgi:hypothetical protein
MALDGRSPLLSAEAIVLLVVNLFLSLVPLLLVGLLEGLIF